MAGDWVDEPEAAVEHVLDTLPATFSGLDLLVVAVQLGGGAGSERTRGRPYLQARFLALPRSQRRAA
jgi:hypothetical protein